MGVFNVTIEVGDPSGGDLTEVSAVVDTGAIHSMVPESLLSNMHIEPLARRTLSIADGSEVSWGVGEARIAYDGEEWICPVVFGPDDLYLLGATTLEAFGLMADPVNQILIPVVYRARPF